MNHSFPLSPLGHSCHRGAAVGPPHPPTTLSSKGRVTQRPGPPSSFCLDSATGPSAGSQGGEEREVGVLSAPPAPSQRVPGVPGVPVLLGIDQTLLRLLSLPAVTDPQRHCTPGLPSTCPCLCGRSRPLSSGPLGRGVCFTLGAWLISLCGSR